MLLSQVIKIFSIGIFSFIFAMAIMPLVLRLLLKFKFGKQIRTEGAPIFASLHKKKEGTPTMGGIIIWVSVLASLIVFYVISKLMSPGDFFANLNFWNRQETYLPVGLFFSAAIIGFFDDLLGVLKIGPKGGGLKMRHRLVLYTFIAALGAYWFYFKLGWDILHIPILGDFNVGIWYILIFLFAIVASSFSVNETDGLDGLAGGIVLIGLAAFVTIAFLQGRFHLAAFCGAIIGSTVAFLWFNIYPAKFFMGDTGSMSLGVILGVLAMLTNSFFLLPFIAFIPMIESLSVIIQVISKKIFKRKIFISTPIHHHFEAKNWPETMITMRFWIIGVMMAAVGLIINFVDRII